MTASEITKTVAVRANGMAFTADVCGTEDGGLVLMLHGFPQTRHTWRRELVAVAAEGLRGCAPDQRGYSAGARPSGTDAYRTEHLVEDALAVADVLGAPWFHLVGHDWGGHLAWIIAALHPERVRSLAIISRPHPRAFLRALANDPEQSRRSRHHRTHQRAAATRETLGENGCALRERLTRAGVPDADVDVYLATVGEFAAMDAALSWYRAVGDSAIKAGKIPPVEVPTLYVWGESDSAVGRFAAETTQEFVNAPYTFVPLPGVGHFVTDEAPAAFPPLLVDHLRAHGTS